MTLLKRTVAAMLLSTLMPQLTGCAIRITQRISPAQLRPEDMGLPGSGEARVVGVSTKAGRQVMFDTLPDVWVGRYVLYAHVNGISDSIPKETIVKWWVARPGDRAVPVEAASLGAALTEASARKTPIVGVTLGSGDEVRFDQQAPVRLAKDTLHATVRGAAYATGLADVRRVWVQRTSAGLSLLVNAAAVAVVTALVVVVAFATGPFNLGGQ